MNIIGEFARREGVSEQQVRDEMQAAIDEGIKSGAMAEMFGKRVPTPDELIDRIIQNLITEKTK